MARISNADNIPQKWVTTNYHTVFSDSLFTSALRNSIGISVIATGLSVIVAMFAAYAIARLEFPGKKVLLSTALAIAISAIPPRMALRSPRRAATAEADRASASSAATLKFVRSLTPGPSPPAARSMSFSTGE